MDYNEYRLSLTENMGIALGSILLTAVISNLFYDNWLAMPGCVFVIWFLRRLLRAKRIEERRTRLQKQFLDTMQFVSNSLLSGYSMENAWKEGERELVQMYGEKAPMCVELHRMNQSISLNIPLEQLLDEFAGRTGADEIESFAEVFAFAKRSGGNLISIIENTTGHIRAKFEVEQEIEVLVASKRLEQNILNVIPMCILAYLKFTSMDYLSVMYGNAFGVLFMTGALAVYAAAILLSQKILRIRL